MGYSHNAEYFHDPIIYVWISIVYKIFSYFKIIYIYNSQLSEHKHEILINNFGLSLGHNHHRHWEGKVPYND